jgi:hypothetical protein
LAFILAREMQGAGVWMSVFVRGPAQVDAKVTFDFEQAKTEMNSFQGGLANAMRQARLGGLFFPLRVCTHTCKAVHIS